MQVFCDLISTKDGRVLGPKRSLKDKQFVKVFMSNPDLLYKDKWPESRFGPLVINIMLQSVFKATYGYEVEVQQFGKPMKGTYDYARTLLQKQAAAKGVQIGNCYMIGDNPKSDIAGGNLAGMTTILVRTGVFDSKAPSSLKGNDREHPATHVVKDFEAAIQLIYKNEGLL